jgi:hypothetical protein
LRTILPSNERYLSVAIRVPYATVILAPRVRLPLAGATAVVLIVALAACSTHGDQRVHRTPVRAAADSTISQDGATLFLPAGSIDRNTTARITKTSQTPPNGAPVPGYEFDIADAKIIKPIRITLPVTDEPHAAPDGTMLVPYLSDGRWGTEVGHYDPVSHTVTVNASHLSWYGDFATVAYQFLRKTLGEWLGKFRASPPRCSAGPALRYPLETIGEPPVLACVSGSGDSGTLT